MHGLDAGLLLIAVALAASGLGVVVLCWRRHAVLAGLPALGGVLLAGVAIWREVAGRPVGTVLLGAFGALLLAVALVVIGSALWRLLEEPSDLE